MFETYFVCVSQDRKGITFKSKIYSPLSVLLKVSLKLRRPNIYVVYCVCGLFTFAPNRIDFNTIASSICYRTALTKFPLNLRNSRTINTEQRMVKNVSLTLNLILDKSKDISPLAKITD